MTHSYVSSTHAVGKPGCSWGASTFVAILVWLIAAPTFAGPGSAAVQIDLLDSTPDHVVLQYQVGDYAVEAVNIDGHEYTQIQLGTEAPMKTLGAPALPKVSRSIIIPDDARMKINVLASTYHEISDIDVAPSKGFILRTVNPDDVPYTFGEVYNVDAFFPGNLAALRDPYILRDHRGTVVDFHPFQYNPVTRTLRVYTDVTVEVVSTGPGQINVLTRPAQARDLSLAFHTIYQHQFLNYEPQSRYVPLDESGDMLIICYDAWLANIQPLVDHKNAQGITTTAVGVSTIGNTYTAIKNYIQGVYNTSDLAFVLLVGDGAQVDTPYASGGSSDPTYSKLAGSDNYPDVIVGRFSAQSSAQVNTQVERTITYETLPATLQDWFWRGTGIASNQGPGDDGEYDNVHIDNIRDDLLVYGYTIVDQIYDPSASASQVTVALNNGRGIINYCGHGSTTSWSSSGFSSSHVNALANDNMLPFIVSVACVNGQFDGPTCFGEAWLRATHDGVPTGAIGAYMSSINQTWDPPMEAQDEFNFLLVHEAYTSYGALCYAGSCSMMDKYGSGGVDMFNTWHIFGDPSVEVAAPRGDCDFDGDIDGDDFAVLEGCFSGPGGGLGEGCECVDMDGDGDVDCKDYNLFAQMWNGAGDPPGFVVCSSPVASAAGGRYLAVTPNPGSDPIALWVTGDRSDFGVRCVSAYVQADGSLGDTPVFRLPSGPDGWNTINVFGEEILPNTLYLVQADFGTPGNPALSPAGSTTTMLWGDAECNFIINFTDIQWIILAFEGTAYRAPFEAMNIAPCALDDTLNFSDVQASVLSFEGTEYRGAVCAPPCQ